MASDRYGRSICRCVLAASVTSAHSVALRTGCSLVASPRCATMNSPTRSDGPDVSRKLLPLDERPKMSHRLFNNEGAGLGAYTD